MSLAGRGAQRAESHGNGLYLAKQAEDADKRYDERQKTSRLEAEAELDKTKSELNDIESRMQLEDADVAALGARRDELVAAQLKMSQQLSVSASALATSEEARKAADARAAAAIASLRSLANVKEEASHTLITLSGSVLFTTGESTILPLAQQSLIRVAAALKELPPERKIVIEGHTDSMGEDSANQQLSQSRAEAVMNVLVSQGVSSKNLSAVGRGESLPVASNETAEGRANNRRVELIISK